MYVEQIDGNSFELLEKKTGKRRIVRINPGFQKHIKDCYKKLESPEKNESVFLSREHKVYSTQRINVIFKEVKKHYRIKINHFSTHSLRKTFGRKVVDSAGNDSEMALIKLSEIFNHSSPAITRRYLELRQEEIGKCMRDWNSRYIRTAPFMIWTKSFNFVRLWRSLEKKKKKKAFFIRLNSLQIMSQGKH